MKIIDVQGFSVKRERRSINHRRSWCLSPTGELAARMPCWNHDGFAETPSHSYSELRSGFPWAPWRIIKDNFHNFSKNSQAEIGGEGAGRNVTPYFRWAAHVSNPSRLRVISRVGGCSITVKSTVRINCWNGAPASHLVWRRWHFLNPRTLIRSNKR